MSFLKIDLNVVLFEFKRVSGNDWNAIATYLCLRIFGNETV